MKKHSLAWLLLLPLLFVYSCTKVVTRPAEEVVLFIDSEYIDHNPGWSYATHNWLGVGSCSDPTNLFQSPINIKNEYITDTRTVTDLPLSINYQEFPLVVDNNGHTIQVMAPDAAANPSAAYIVYKNVKYNLVQFHFHAHSENMINGAGSKMEVHFVNKNMATGDLVVLGIFLDVAADTTNPVYTQLSRIWKLTPHESGHVYKAYGNTGGANVDPVKIADLNAAGHIYAFQGSLTTPGCTGNVNWLLFEKPKTISQKQYEAFTHLYPNNYRDTQLVNHRPIIKYVL